MSRFRTVYLSILVLASFASILSAQEKNSANTMKRGEKFVAPKATIDDVSWIAGHWQGSAMGGEFEETWNSPSSGTMMGMFKFFQKDEIQFMELLTIGPKDNSLTLRLKHFGADLKGWEEKDEVIEFPLVKLTENEAYFEGLTFRKTDDQTMKIFVVVGEKDGKSNEVEFACKLGSVQAAKMDDTKKLADGIYLVNRWSIDRTELTPLLPNEIVVQHDIREISPNEKDPLKFLTLRVADGVQFSDLEAATLLPQEDGKQAMSVVFDDAAAQRLEAMSRQHLGRQIAVVFGGRALTMHKIRSTIRDGKLKISRCTDDGCETILQTLKEKSK